MALGGATVGATVGRCGRSVAVGSGGNGVGVGGAGVAVGATVTMTGGGVIKWVRAEKSLTPDKPFFLYFAPGATHAPHHVPKEWIAKYKGKFDQGWDKLREETLARQKKLGVVPPDTKLAAKPEAIKDWDTLTADEKTLFARQMEIYAAFGEYADFEI